ncbi:ribonuclease HII [Clostridium senegalense]|uniref:ribonuclease HII n=1 Tax=Clostridium senegalense TaxID=1465809 RepID=UPI003CC825D8
MKFALVKEYVLNFQNNNDIRTSKLKFMELIKMLNDDSRKNVNKLGEKLEKIIIAYEAEVNRVKDMYIFDKNFGDFKYIAGVDEVGRGPLAGPIVSAAVILNLNYMDDRELMLYINDSKKLSPEKRKYLSEIIKSKAVSYNISVIDNKEIDEKGIGWCNQEVFRRACYGLDKKPDLVLSDGYLIKEFDIENKSVIKGDTKSASIACASILAKVYRDKIMEDYHQHYPEYKFCRNVGYGTEEHVQAIKRIGITEIHRKSFLTNILNK